MQLDIKKTDWEKVTVYVAITAMLITGFVYIADIKERVRACEVRFEERMGKVKEEKKL